MPTKSRSLITAVPFVFLLAACADVSGDAEAELADDTVVPDDGSAIIRGDAAEDTARAVQGAIFAAGRSSYAAICGVVYLGTDPRGQPWAATAAHCANALSSGFRFGFGGLAIHSYGASNTVGFAEAIKHPQWNQTTLVNDVAVVRLSAVPPNAVPVRLADPANDAAVGETVTISGYGRVAQPTLLCTYFGLSCPAVADALLQSEVTVLSTSACAQSFGTIDGRQICVRDPDRTQGACNGDSGGPMFRSDGTVVGLTSFGSSDCGPSSPQVYTRVSAFRDWIRSTTGI